MTEKDIIAVIERRVENICSEVIGPLLKDLESQRIANIEIEQRLVNRSRVHSQNINKLKKMIDDCLDSNIDLHVGVNDLNHKVDIQLKESREHVSKCSSVLLEAKSVIDNKVDAMLLEKKEEIKETADESLNRFKDELQAIKSQMQKEFEHHCHIYLDAIERKAMHIL